MRIELRARDAKFEPVENARVTVKLQRVGAIGAHAEIALPAEASAKEPGVLL